MRRTKAAFVIAVGVCAIVAAVASQTTGRASTANNDWPAYAGDKASTKY